MQAKVGDRLVIRGHREGEPDRGAEIIEIRGEHGQPPYVVRWGDGHESWMVPGPDAIVEEHATEGGTP